MRRTARTTLIGIVSIILSSTSFISKTWAEDHNAANLMEMSLEQLEGVQVTSVSKKPESPFRAAAAITVLTQDDIERSGATSIAEALRLVPGLDVARANSNKWTISSRGFNRFFANKLLVLLDGRTIYTPLVSGVYWNLHNVTIEDIDRIEIIRGPGATLWGANAVNGIINIITKNSAYTQGTHTSALYGNEEQNASVRYGSKIKDDFHYRVYGNHLIYEPSRNAANGDKNNDEWYITHAGFRADWRASLEDNFRFQGELHSGEAQQTYFLPGLNTPGVSSPVDADDNYTGAYALGEWKHYADNGAEQILQMYLEHINRDVTNNIDQWHTTIDIDFQSRFKLNERNEIVWGVGDRLFKDNLDGVAVNGITYINYRPEQSYNNLLSAFIQDEYAVIPEELYLTFGSKFEHNYYTDFEVQPNVRLAWYPTRNQTLWGAISRAVRTPTKSERGLSSIGLSRPAGFINLSASADRNFDSEQVVAYEAGYRLKPTWWALIDATAFYNDYDELRSFEPGASDFNVPNTIAELIAENLGYGETYGVEAALKLNVTENWDLTLNYTFLDMQMHLRPGSLDTLIAGEEDKSPEQQVGILSRLNVTDDVNLDTNIFYVDELAAFDIPDYIRFDARLAWQPADHIEISLVGQNLFDPAHQEFDPFLYEAPVDAEIERSVYLKLNINF